MRRAPKRRKDTGTIDVPADDADQEVSEPAALEEGAHIGRYRIVTELGRGAMGAVYLAQDPDLGREVALKVLLGGQFAGDAQVQRFRREAAIAAKLSHPHLVGVHDVGIFRGTFYYTMDFVNGPSLADVIEKRQLKGPRATFGLLAKVASAVHHLHEHGVVHRDLKPANIMLGPDGEPLVTDFGLAVEVSSDHRLTQSGQILGTPYYMAPEQFLSTRDVDGRADVWALGVIGYEAITGQLPFMAETARGIMEAVLQQEPPSLRKLVPDLPGAVVAIIERALEKPRAKRYESAGQMAEDLAAFSRGEPIFATERGPVTKFLRRAYPHRRLILALALALPLLLAGGLWGLAERRRLAVRDALAVARDHLAAGRRAEGLDATAKGLALDPTHTALLALRAEALAGLGRHLEAVAEWGRILAGDGDGLWHLARSVSLRELGREAEADADLAEARRRGGEAFEAETARLETEARKVYDLNQFAQALDLAARALQRRPDAESLHLLRWRCYAQAQRLGLALPHARKLVAIAPERLDYHRNLGETLAVAAQEQRDAKLSEEAVEVLDRVFAAQPDQASQDDALFNRYNIALEFAYEGSPGGLLQRARKLEWAVNQNRSNQKHNRTCSLHQLSWTLRAMGRPAEALKALEIAAQTDPGFMPYTRLELAKHWEEVGEPERACEELRVLLKETAGGAPGSLQATLHRDAQRSLEALEHQAAGSK